MTELSSILTERESAIRAAAYIDTDGCIHISKEFILRCTLVSVTPSILYWMQEHYDGSVLNIRGKGDRTDGFQRRDLYQWTIFSLKAEAFLKAILPFLIIKTEQAEVGLQLRALQGFHRRSESSKQKVIEWTPLLERMKALNHIGISPTPPSTVSEEAS